MKNNTCRCGCGAEVAAHRQFVSGHNLKTLAKTAEHARKIGEGQKRAWQTKRQRLPVGTKRHGRDGYILVKVHAGAGHWRPEHLIVMEQYLGRKLKPQEIVHHINGKRDDNRLENLYLCKDRSDHNRVHRSADETLRQLIEHGIVRFNRDSGEYEAILSR